MTLKPKPESVLLGLMAFMMLVLLLMVLVLAEQAEAGTEETELRPWCFSQASVGTSSVYSGNHSLGWHFYCDRTDEKEAGEPESAVNQTPESVPEFPQPPEDDAIGKIRELRRATGAEKSGGDSRSDHGECDVLPPPAAGDA